MGTVPLLDDDALAPRARAVFDDIRATRGTDYVNNFWRALAHDPDTLEAQLDVADNAVILKTYKNFEEIRGTLERLRLDDKTVLVSRLGMEDESILMDIKDAPKKPHYFSLALVKKHRNS